MTSQHCFRSWLCTIRTNVDPLFCYHMASLGNSELNEPTALDICILTFWGLRNISTMLKKLYLMTNLLYINLKLFKMCCSVAGCLGWLVHCGLVMLYGDMNVSQHWLRLWPVTWHQVITRTNVDLSSLKYSGIHLRAISQKFTSAINHQPQLSWKSLT